METTQSQPQTQKIIKQALEYLSGVCDGARTIDGAGFNKFDAGVGKMLASKVELSASEQEFALRLLQKYRTQLLLEAGIELPVVKQSAIEITLNEALVLIFFASKPSEEVRAFIKSIAGWHWNPDLPGKPWSVPYRHADKVVDYFAKLDAVISPEVIDAAEYCKKQQTQQQTQSQPQVPDTKIKVGYDNHKLIVTFAYDKSLVAKAQSLPERKWNPTAKQWEVPLKLASKIEKLFPDAEWSEEARRAVEQQNGLANMSRKAESDFNVSGLKGELMPFQRAGVEFLVAANGRALVGDEMGLGKTIQAIAYLQLYASERPAVIVVPASLKMNWHNEISKWMTTGDIVTVVNGGNPVPVFETGTTILIINYDVLGKWLEYLRKSVPAIVIFDEAHYMKNSGSQRSKAGRELAKIAKKVICLTGTPLTNRPIELYPLLSMIAPQAWSNEWQYKQRYCHPRHNGYGWDFTGASNLDELHELIKPYMVRRTKSQVLTELPEKRYAPVILTLSKSSLKEYDLVMAGLKDVIRKVDRQHPQATANVLAEIERAKQAVAHAKLDAVIEWIDNFLDSGNKLVVFCNHRFVIDRLAEIYGDSAVILDGTCTLAEREKAVSEFQNNPRVKLFIGNIKAAGVGITLTAASDVAFIEYPWTPGDLTQAIDRCHRIGQKSSVTAWFLAVQNTIEEKIIALLEEKRKVIEQVHDGIVSEASLNIFSELLDTIE